MMRGRIKRSEGVAKQLLPIIGNIRIGAKAVSRNGKEYPTSLDYFVATGQYEPLFRQAYGEKPSTIQIAFLEDDPAKVCNERYEYRDDRGALLAYGDGEIYKVWNGTEYREYSLEKWPTLMTDISAKFPNKTGWQITLTMVFAIPMVRSVAGLWKFTTKATKSTIPSITATFDTMQAMNGQIKGVICDLTVQMHKSNKPGVSSVYPVVSLVPNVSEDNISKIKNGGKLLLNEVF